VVVERPDVHRGEAPAPAPASSQRKAMSFIATQHTPIRGIGDQRRLGPKVAEGVPWQGLYAG
jgi:hypothetical protein